MLKSAEPIGVGRVESSPGIPPRRHAEVVRIDRNLASLGVFTPSSKRVREQASKTTQFTRFVESQQLHTRAEILASPEYGLPSTGDQDKFIAFSKIVGDERRRLGVLRNPVSFSSAELLRILECRVTAGKNYEDIATWLRRMAATRIRSEGSIYLARRKVWVHETFRIFDLVVPFGAPMPDVGFASRNYVWLSEWQLENINHNYLIPVDFDAYRRLRNHIAKVTAPLLQVWLSQTREIGKLEKSYDEFCHILNIPCYPHRSKALEKLAPSLDELKEAGYLSDWVFERGAGAGFNITFHHGEKFRQPPQFNTDSAPRRR